MNNDSARELCGEPEVRSRRMNVVPDGKKLLSSRPREARRGRIPDPETQTLPDAFWGGTSVSRACEKDRRVEVTPAIFFVKNAIFMGKPADRYPTSPGIKSIDHVKNYPA